MLKNLICLNHSANYLMCFATRFISNYSGAIILAATNYGKALVFS